MEAESSQRNLEPLLHGEAPPTGPRMGAYAPPSSHTSAIASVPQPHPPSHFSQPARAPVTSVRPESYDLHLTATDETGNVFPSPSAEDDDLPQLPPLVSYCSYVRYGCAFGKWFIPVVIANVVALAICIKDQYFDYNHYWPVDSWRGLLLASVWFGTAVFFYFSAKAIERDVQRIDHMGQYEQGRLSEDGNDITPGFAPNYEHVYGQVSRKIDAAFTPKTISSSSNAHGTAGSAPPPDGTSSLVNLSYAFWAALFGLAVFLGTELLVAKHYVKVCDAKNIPEGNSTNARNKNDFAYISKYPEDVKDWIAERRDPWGYEVRIINQDDGFEEYGGNARTYDFPTSYSTDPGAFASMKDGTVFFAAQPPVKIDGGNTDDEPPVLGESYTYANHLVLVESPGNGGPAKYYPDIINPRMFIPVQNTMVKNDRGNMVATQYCFTSALDEAERRKERRSWDAKIRLTPIRCIITTSGGAVATNSSSFEMTKVNIAWKDKTESAPQVQAASTGGEILIVHCGTDGRYRYQEAVSLNPSSMETKHIYHLTSDNVDFYGWEGDSHPNTRCIQDKVVVYGAIAGLVVLVLCGLWLILREGVPAGASPLALAVVGLIRCFSGEYDQGMSAMSLTFGTLFFHFVLCCENGRLCHLPAWIGRDIYVWGLYSWILSFFAMDIAFRMSNVIILSAVLFGLTGIILNHPIPQLMGSACIVLAVLQLIIWPFSGGYGYGSYFAFFALFLILGIGMIGIGNFVSNNRRYCSAICRPISRASNTMFYGSASSAGGAVGSNRPIHSSPVVTQV